MQSISLLALIGAAQGFLLCVVILAVGAGDRLANRFLAGFVLVESVRLLLAFLAFAHVPIPPEAYVLFSVSLARGPLLYLYVRQLTSEHPLRTRSMIVHFVPLALSFLASSLYLLSDFYSASAYEGDRAWFSTTTSTAPVAIHAMISSTISLVYAIASLFRLRAHEHNIRELFSTLERIDLRWLTAVILVVVGCSLIYLGNDLLRLMRPMDAQPKFWVSIAFTISIVYLISIGGLRQRVIYKPAAAPGVQSPAQAPLSAGTADHSEARRPAARATVTERKYERSGLDDARSLALWKRLQALMRDERPHVESKANLRSLAGLLEVSPQDLSQTINTHAKTKFYEYVNQHRVEVAKELLSDLANRDRTLLDIGLDAGFNSQATFYKHFKKGTGMTPKAFRKQADRREPQRINE